MGQIRIQIAYARVWGARFRTVGREEKDREYLLVLVAGEDGGGRRRSPGRRPRKEKARERERERRAH